eukprot:2862824-Heterocapsa_arctica.AAC.1
MCLDPSDVTKFPNVHFDYVPNIAVFSLVHYAYSCKVLRRISDILIFSDNLYGLLRLFKGCNQCSHFCPI